MYSVRFYPNGDFNLLMEVTSQLYDTYEFPRLEFSKPEYLQKVAIASAEESTYFCFKDGRCIGGITVSDEMYDVHFNGTGRHITNCVILPGVDSRKALSMCISALREGGKGEGSSWYSTTHRRDFYTLVTRYRRIPNG